MTSGIDIQPCRPAPMYAWLVVGPLPVGSWYAHAIGVTHDDPTGVVLTAWFADRRPHPQARRVDPRVLAPEGATAWLSLLWPHRDALPLFDDPSVQQARRTALVLPTPRAVTTATVDSTHCAGALWVTDTAAQAAANPFRLLGSTRLLQVKPGLLGRSPGLVGPAIERYAGAPWPAGRF